MGKYYKYLSILSVIIILLGCTRVVEENMAEYNAQFENDLRIQVVRKNIVNREVGVITDIIYTSSHVLEYDVTIKPDRVSWVIVDGEPKKFYKCISTNDKAPTYYIYSKVKNPNPLYKYPDLVAPVPISPVVEESHKKVNKNSSKPKKLEVVTPEKPEPRMIIAERYNMFIDKRYFFKLLGESFWVDVPKEDFAAQTLACESYKIPNEGVYPD